MSENAAGNLGAASVEWPTAIREAETSPQLRSPACLPLRGRVGGALESDSQRQLWRITANNAEVGSTRRQQNYTSFSEQRKQGRAPLSENVL